MNLPAPRPAGEIASGYAPLLARQRRRYEAAMRARGLAPQAAGAALDAVLSLFRDARGCLLRVVDWGDAVAARLLSPPAFGFAGARGAGGAGAQDAAGAVALEKEGGGCAMRATVEARGETADVSVVLLDDGGLPILPFSLTVEDAETGAALLDGMSFRSGAASLKGVTAGSYRVHAEADGRRCDFSFQLA